MLFRRLVVLPILGCLAISISANAQQNNVAAARPAPPPIAGDLLSDGFEVKTVINNTYLILQKGGKAYWCGSTSPNLTWANWAAEMRDAPCTALNR